MESGVSLGSEEDESLREILLSNTNHSRKITMSELESFTDSPFNAAELIPLVERELSTLMSQRDIDGFIKDNPGLARAMKSPLSLCYESEVLGENIVMCRFYDIDKKIEVLNTVLKSLKESINPQIFCVPRMTSGEYDKYWSKLRPFLERHNNYPLKKILRKRFGKIPSDERIKMLNTLALFKEIVGDTLLSLA